MKWSVSPSVLSDSLWPHGLQPTRLLCPWDFPGKNKGEGCCSLLQGIFPTQWSNPGLLHCRQILYHLRHQGSPAEWRVWRVWLSSSKAVPGDLHVGKHLRGFKWSKVHNQGNGIGVCLLKFPFILPPWHKTWTHQVTTCSLGMMLSWAKTGARELSSLNVWALVHHGYRWSHGATSVPLQASCSGHNHYAEL